MFPKALYKRINDSLKTGDFPFPLKLAEITTIHKEEGPFDEDNYWSISILTLISKVYEKYIYSHVYSYMQQYLNPLLYESLQAHGT